VMYAGQEMEAAPAETFFARPAHPYTRRLLASVPSAGGEIRDIPGDVPSLIAPPSGCRFHPRCEYATAECREGRPPPRVLAPGHGVRCHHPVDAPMGADARPPARPRSSTWSTSPAISPS